MFHNLSIIWLVRLIWLSAACLAILAGARFVSGPESLILQPAAIRHETGCAYHAPVKSRPAGWPIYQFFGDSSSNPRGSKLILLENGRTLGPAHAMHDTIRTSGGATYSHWGPDLYFSASDCSDPRTNGRRYEAALYPDLASWAGYATLAAATALFLLMTRYLSAHSMFRARMARVTDILRLATLPTAWPHRPLTQAALLMGIIVSAWGLIGFAWSGTVFINGLALQGHFQISDSTAYWYCSNNLLDTGTFSPRSLLGEWCQRRSIYPTALAGITWLAQRNIFSTLLLQAAIVSMAIYVLARRSAQHFGIIGAAVVVVLLYAFAGLDLFTVTMTENIGMIVGCVAVACLLVSVDRRSPWWMSSGIALLSIALNARAGAFLVLPLLVIWSAYAARCFERRAWRWIAAATGAAAAGFALQALLVLAAGGSPGNSHGNFSYVLYGLAAGGKGWLQVLVDHPEIAGSDASMSRAIYALAWKEFLSRPELFLVGLEKNVSHYLTYGSFGFDKFGWLSPIVKGCWWLGWLPLLLNRRNPVHALVALGSLGVVLSAPLLMADGGHRIFAATAAFDALQVAVGASWAWSILAWGSMNAPPFRPPTMPTELSGMPKLLPTPEAGFAAFLAVLVLIPHSALGPLQSLDRPSPPQCGAHEYTVLTSIGSGGSLLLNIVDDSHFPNVFRGEVRRVDFNAGIKPWAWWHDELISFRGKSLLLAYQIDRRDPQAPGPYPVFSNQDLAAFHGRVVRLCIDREGHQKLFGTIYRHLNSITPLD